MAWFEGLPHDYGELRWRKIGGDMVWMFMPETWTVEQDDDLFWTCYDARRTEADDWGAFWIGRTYLDVFNPSEEEMLVAERDGVVSHSFDHAYTAEMLTSDDDEGEDDDEEYDDEEYDDEAGEYDDGEAGPNSVEEEDGMIRYAYRRLDGTPIGLRIANFTFGLRKELVDDPAFEELYRVMRSASEAADIALHPTRPITELEE